VAVKFNELADKFRQMKIDSVKFFAYDINTQSKAPRIENSDVPAIFFMPAFKKTPPYLRFLGNPRVSEIGAFVKKHASIKFDMTIDLAQME
jgi:hypothetical protein